MPKSSLRALSVVLLFLALASAAVAQTTGTIRGEAKDQDGNSLPGVTVTATNEGRGTSRTTITGASGRYVLSSIAVGTYVVSAKLEGFQDREFESVRVGISSTVKLDLTMVLATVEETITVTGTPVLDVTSSSVGSSYSSDFVEDLPTERNFWDMMAVSPGVSPESDGSTSMSAFGSSIQSNSWSVDGLETTNTDTGNAWWYINPDTIEEVQVLAIGAPAQYGNMSGAAFNVVTKSGTNDLEGSVNMYYQDDSLTEENAEINGIAFRRDEFLDTTATLGGPLKRDKIWFFAALEYARDASSSPGVDPNFPDTYPSDRYDLKVTSAINDSNLLEAKYHYEKYDWAYGDAYRTPDAQTAQPGTNPAWGIQLQSVLSDDNFLEVHYAGYSGEDSQLSRTGSTADPFIDYSPEGGGPTTYSEGLAYPYIWDLSREQADISLSNHTDNFLTGDHDFKFGISYGKGEGDTRVAGGPNGVYFYQYDYSYDYYGTTYTTPYYYRVTARPYHYGAVADSVSAFVDDSWQVTSNLTLNVGVRFDQHNADIPDYPVLNQDWSPTDETIPGLKDAVDWTLWSPRIGFAYQIGEKGVLRGFYGKFYDGNVTGNWYSPPPGAPDYLYEFSTSLDGPWTESFLFTQEGTTVDPDLKPPETDQFTLGYERQFGSNFTLGFQGVYKESKNLIGWEILGDGVYEMVDWENPFTGEIIQLASIIEQPSTRKGNGPGAGSLAEPGTKFHQEYKGAVITLGKRYSDGWSMQASYTWSDSDGFLPRALSQGQGNPFYTSGDGRDPNNWINADQALQNEREHVFQFQGNFDLPWNFVGTVVYSFLEGKPYSRQIRVTGLNQGGRRVIAIPADTNTRLPAQNILDLAIGRRFQVGQAVIKTDLQLFNVFNDDAHDWWQTLEVPPGEEFVPSGYLKPRRLQVKLGVSF